MKFSALVVVGDGNGTVGFGIGKASEVPDAIRKGIEDAKKNPDEGCSARLSIPHEITGEFGAEGKGSAEACRPRYRRYRRRPGSVPWLRAWALRISVPRRSVPTIRAMWCAPQSLVWLSCAQPKRLQRFAARPRNSVREGANCENYFEKKPDRQ